MGEPEQIWKMKPNDQHQMFNNMIYIIFSLLDIPVHILHEWLQIKTSCQFISHLALIMIYNGQYGHESPITISDMINMSPDSQFAS